MEIIVGKTAGFCYGVKRAVEGCYNILENKQNNEDVFCLGEIVHNADVVSDLKNKGLNFVENINDTKGKVIVRAHGVSKEIYEQSKKSDIELEDLTCPNVLKIHEIVQEYADEGYYILLCGTKTHPETFFPQ